MPQLTYPSLLKRLASLFYDGLLLLALLLLATFLFVLAVGQAADAPLRYWLQAYLWLVAGVYFVWCWHHGGQTLAMQTWKIRLVSIQGQQISWSQALLRYVLSSIGLLLFAAGFVWALFDREGQFLHDRLCGTRLVLAKA